LSETREPAKPLHDPYAAFRIPAYRRYTFAQMLLQVGTAGQGLAIGWEIYQRTNDALLLGLVGLVQAVPMLLFTLPAGYLADVFDRRKLILLSMLGACLTSLGLAAFSYWQGSIWMMYLLLFLDSASLRLGWPARAALLPALVPRNVFENAVKWRTSMGQISGMIGPVVGGFVLAWWLPGAYLVAAASAVLFMFVLASLPIAATTRAPRGRMLTQLGEGVLFVWRNKLLLGAISLDMFAVLLGGAVYLLPVYARDIIDLGGVGLSPEESLGWLRAAPAAGALIMALTLAHRPPIRRAGRTLLLAVAGFGIATVIFGLSRNFWLSLGMLFLTGVFDNISVVIRHTLVQVITPDEMRGRVSAVNAVFIGSSNELGGFESGLVARWFDAVTSVVSGGIGTLVIVLAWAGLFPRLRRFGALTEVEPATPPAVATIEDAGQPTAEAENRS